MPEYYAIKINEVLSLLKTADDGLPNIEAKKRLEKDGYNELKKGKKANSFILFMNQFKDFLILLLVFATLISIAIGEFIDAAAMFSIVMLSAILGFSQEYRAEKAIEALQKISAPNAKVIRNRKEMKIPARELVIGDIILLEAGDIVPADARLIEVASLKINEASLTGESIPPEKNTGIYHEKTRVPDQRNMAFMGTEVSYGKGKGVVTSTGMGTEFGKIADSIEESDEVQTPLQKKFDRMARNIGFAVIFLVMIVFIAALFRREYSMIELFIFALSLAVAAVPSSLPAIVTIGLSMGAKTLAKKNMIVKKLHAAESLGSVTIICSDKTGTITKNQMTVTKIFTDNKLIEVSGTGYNPEGSFSYNAKKTDPKSFELFLRVCTLCNNSKLFQEKNKWDVLGDPTEGALSVLGYKGKLNPTDLEKKFLPVSELPFDSDRKMMTKIFRNVDKNRAEAYVKGALDILLTKCSRIMINGRIKKLTQKEKDQILAGSENLASQALRVLGMAYRELSVNEQKVKKHTVEMIEKNLIFVGMAGMIDPPRDEVKQSVKDCQDAGIKIMIITGDHAVTAKAIAQKLGLFKKGDLILTGEELDQIKDDVLEKKIESVRIIARALPIQKSRIVDALKKRGHVVAMTGDGVNDAPALKKADIGISMGITGTDVAKEVSKATLVDDNFATIVNGVSEGRNIYDKMIKSTRYLLSCNMGEITAVFMAIMLRFPLPLIPLQILLMNLVTDGLPALGLGVEPFDADVMKRKPRNPKERPITGYILFFIVLFGLVMGAGTLYLFNQYVNKDLKLAQTVAFTTLVMFEMFAVLGSRSLSPLKKINPFSNRWLFGAIISSVTIQIIVIYWPPLQSVFGTLPLSTNDWIKIISISSIGFIFMELSKFVIKKHRSYFAV